MKKFLAFFIAVILCISMFSFALSPFKNNAKGIIGNYYLVGSATATGYKVTLTTATNSQGGAAWFINKVDLSKPLNVKFKIYLGSNISGADGIVFVLQNSSNTAIGNIGGSLGYGGANNGPGGISPSIGIEFDTYYNGGWDPNGNHIGLDLNGNLNSAITANPTFWLEDGNEHKFEFKWDPATKNVSAYLDGTLYINATEDLENIFCGSTCWMGFTGSTGGANNLQYFAPIVDINASAGNGGYISPSGDVMVTYEDSKSFLITPYNGYMISRILVDGSPVHIDNPMGETYTFSNVTSDHTIAVSFDEETMTEIYTLKAAVAAYGGYAQVTPAEQSVQGRSPASILINPDAGYYITGLTDNGNAVAPTAIKDNGNGTFTYSIPSLYEDHNILVTLEKYKYTIDAEAGQGGTITPSGNVSVDYGENKSFTITPDDGYMISQILVDGTALTTTDSTYTFNSVTANHTISATFNALPVANSIMITLQIDNPYITVNGVSTKIDAQGSKPVIEEGRTLVPIRTIIESLGGTVEWDATERKVTTTLSGHSIVLWIDNNTALVDGNKKVIYPDNLSVTPIIINSRTYLPLRFICENLGASVNWYDPTKTITIYYWP
jgi:hypothetical protein